MDIVKITKDNFDKEVKEAKGSVLLDFWAAWCGPCRMLAPVLESLSDRDDVKIGKVNVDEEQALALHYGITSIPTLMVFKDGEVSDTLVGLRSKEEMLKVLGI